MLFDKNSDGFVHTHELGTLVRAINLNPSNNEVQDMIKKIDPNGTGQFNLKQLEQLIRERPKDTETLNDVKEALNVFDTDHDGLITVDEFKFAMTNMGEQMDENEVREILEDTNLVNEGKYIQIEDFARMIMNRI